MIKLGKLGKITDFAGKRANFFLKIKKKGKGFRFGDKDVLEGQNSQSGSFKGRKLGKMMTT